MQVGLIRGPLKGRGVTAPARKFTHIKKPARSHTQMNIIGIRVRNIFRFVATEARRLSFLSPSGPAHPEGDAEKKMILLLFIFLPHAR